MKTIICRIYTIVILTFPFVSLYSFMGSRIVSISHFIYAIICVLLIMLVHNRMLYIGKVELCLLAFAFTIFLNTVILLLINQSKDIVPRNILHLSFLLTIIVFAQYFDIEFAFKVFRVICLFSTLYIIMQTIILMVFKVYIPGIIPGLPIIRNDLESFYETAIRWGGAVRPRSIFGEGAEFAQYNLLYLSLIILNNDKRFRIDKILISTGVLCSASNMGILGLALLWGYYFIQTRTLKQFVYVVFFTAFGAFFALRFGIIDIINRRLFDTSSGYMRMGEAFFGRASGYQVYFSDHHSVLTSLFGNGIISLGNGAFQPSTLCTYVSFGIVGFVAFISIFIYRTKVCQSRISVLLLFVFSAFGNLFYWNFCLFSFAFLITDLMPNNMGNNHKMTTL